MENMSDLVSFSNCPMGDSGTNSTCLANTNIFTMTNTTQDYENFRRTHDIQNELREKMMREKEIYRERYR